MGGELGIVDEQAWQLLRDDLRRIEAKVDNINGLCERVKGLGFAVKWLYGILGGLVVALLVAWIRNGGTG
jgi:tetrahydromethanopterin S-methyltransferase subunit G